MARKLLRPDTAPSEYRKMLMRRLMEMEKASFLSHKTRKLLRVPISREFLARMLAKVAPRIFFPDAVIVTLKYDERKDWLIAFVASNYFDEVPEAQPIPVASPVISLQEWDVSVTPRSAEARKKIAMRLAVGVLTTNERRRLLTKRKLKANETRRNTVTMSPQWRHLLETAKKDWAVQKGYCQKSDKQVRLNPKQKLEWGKFRKERGL